MNLIDEVQEGVKEISTEKITKEGPIIGAKREYESDDEC